MDLLIYSHEAIALSTRQEIEDAIEGFLGARGEVTGGGGGLDGWNIDVELAADAAELLPGLLALLRTLPVPRDTWITVGGRKHLVFAASA
jgi:hypothetical protein